MKTLNFNIVYSVKTNVKSGNKFEYRIYLSVNIENESLFVFSGYEYYSCSQSMINDCINKVLEHLEKELNDFSTISPNLVCFDF